MSANQVVRSFIAAVEAKDLAAAGALLHPEVSYENVPIDPVVGREATVAVLDSFLAPAGEVEWIVVRELEQGRLVMNERLDRFRIGDGWLELPVAGVFEVDDEGLITLWRDFFDMTSYMTQMEALTGS